MQEVSLPARIGALAIRLWNSDLRAYVPYAAVGTVTCIVAIGSIRANYGYLEQLTGHPDNVFTARLGDFASAFDRAAQVIP